MASASQNRSTLVTYLTGPGRVPIRMLRDALEQAGSSNEKFLAILKQRGVSAATIQAARARLPKAGSPGREQFVAEVNAAYNAPGKVMNVPLPPTPAASTPASAGRSGPPGSTPAAPAPTPAGPSGPSRSTPATPAPAAPAAPGAPGSPPPSGNIDQAVREKFGYLASFLDIPEIGGLLRRATSEGWVPEKLQAELMATGWWQHTSQAQRQWLAIKASDPASAGEKVASVIRDQIRPLVEKFGMTLPLDRARQFAEDSLQFGWSSQDLQRAVVNEYHFNPNTGYGLTQKQRLTQIASNYLIPLSDKTIGKWVEDITTGRTTEEQFGAYLREQAKSLFPGLAKAIDSGVTVGQYIEPYRQYAAQTLEMNPNDIDFTDPKWMRALNQIDPKTGERISMSLSEWNRTLRTDPMYGWSKTSQARSQAADLSRTLLQTFGAVA